MNEQRLRAHHLLSFIENLYHDGYYAGSPEVLYSLIESCIDERPISSIISLFDYRVSVSFLFLNFSVFYSTVNSVFK